MAKYRVLIGQHVEQVPLLGPDGRPRLDHEKNVMTRDVIYHAGDDDVIETRANLLRMNGAGQLRPKYERIFGEAKTTRQMNEENAALAAAGGPAFRESDYFEPEESASEAQTAPQVGVPAVVAPPRPKTTHAQLSSMSPAELKRLAEENEIDLKGATKKEDMVRIIESQVNT